MGLSVGFFRNFQDCFRIIQTEFRDYFRIVRAKFSRLFLDSSNKIFETVFGQFGTVLKFGFDPGTDVFGFCGVFWYLNNSVTNREGTKRCPVFYRSEILVILCVIVRKINNMLLCVKFMLICVCVIY